MALMEWEKKQKKAAARLKTAAKGSGSRLLQQTSNKMNKSDEMEAKLEAMSELYRTMEQNLREGDIKFDAAIADFTKGAKAIFGKKSE